MIIKPQIQNSGPMMTFNEEFLAGLDVKTSSDDGAEGKCQFNFAGHRDHSAADSKESKARDRGSGRKKRKFNLQGDELAYDNDFMKLV